MDSELSNLVRKRRKALKLSRDDLASLSGVSRNAIAKFETGQSDIKLQTLMQLLEPLGLQLTIEIGNAGLQIDL